MCERSEPKNEVTTLSMPNLLAIYASKAGSIFFGILIIPFYAKLTDETVFGQISLSLTLLSICLMLDFGISTVIARRVALKGKLEVSEILGGQIALVFAYFTVGVIVSFATWVFGYQITSVHLATWGYIFLFVSNNLFFMSLSAAQYHFAASVQLTVGLVLRATTTIFLIIYLGSNIENFALGMVYAGLLQSILSLALVLRRSERDFLFQDYVAAIKSIFRSAPALAVVGVSGSLFLNFDKISIAYYFSIEDLGPYFLAMTLCMLPINALAVPLLQYFQPKITNQVRNPNVLPLVLTQFFKLIVTFCVIPSVLLYIFLPVVIDAWLGDVSYKLEVQAISQIILPFMVAGAFGVLPLSVIIALAEFSLQAKVSLVLTFFYIVVILFLANLTTMTIIVYAVGIFQLVSAVVFLPRIIQFLRNQHV